MDKKLLILSALTLVSIVGIVLYQINIQGNPFLLGLGFLLSALCIIVAMFIALLYPK
ncbi:MAG: hypothetical protein GYA51_10330 [Candidatus Methanofastidiosa archaeon]|jgi:hypothetical protein|nr:hypothetical protein [Candidatus Methanofastidiosa archaeon]